MSYGQCPKCARSDAPGSMRERSPNGRTFCGWCKRWSSSRDWVIAPAKHETTANENGNTVLTIRGLRSALKDHGLVLVVALNVAYGYRPLLALTADARRVMLEDVECNFYSPDAPTNAFLDRYAGQESIIISQMVSYE